MLSISERLPAQELCHLVWIEQRIYRANEFSVLPHDREEPVWNGSLSGIALPATDDHILAIAMDAAIEYERRFMVERCIALTVISIAAGAIGQLPTAIVTRLWELAISRYPLPLF